MPVGCREGTGEALGWHSEGAEERWEGARRCLEGARGARRGVERGGSRGPGAGRREKIGAAEKVKMGVELDGCGGKTGLT